MKNHLLVLTLLLVLPLVLLGCARSGETMMDDDLTLADEAAVPIPVEGGTDEAMQLLGATTSESNTIVENAAAIPNLSNLVEAVQAAGLAETLSGPGPYTVFAPTNAAFELIDRTEFDAIMSEERQEDLAQLLRSHVTDGEVTYGELNEGQIVVMLSGADIQVNRDMTDQLLKQIGEADFIVYDIESSNGIIHIINLVLDPEGFFSQM
jgi:uncharacterized surface protein with fasciclin (FAS1) repeats